MDSEYMTPDLSDGSLFRADLMTPMAGLEDWKQKIEVQNWTLFMGSRFDQRSRFGTLN